MTISIVRTNTISGTSFSIDVTGLALSSNLSEVDFVVTHAGINVTSSYTKTSATLLSYSGVNVTLGTMIDVRRNTPLTEPDLVYLTTTTASNLTNDLQRLYRKLEENDAAVNLILSQLTTGGISLGTVNISDNAYNATTWNGIANVAPSQNAVRDVIETKANIASPTFTGVPAAPTAASSTNTTQLATTEFVKNQSNGKVILQAASSPNQTLNNPGDTQLTIATTASFLNSNYASYASGGFFSVVNTGWYLVSVQTIINSIGGTPPTIIAATYTCRSTDNVEEFRIGYIRQDITIGGSTFQFPVLLNNTKVYRIIVNLGTAGGSGFTMRADSQNLVVVSLN